MCSHVSLNVPSYGKETDSWTQYINTCMCASVVYVLCIYGAWGAPNLKGKVEAIAAFVTVVTPAVLLVVIPFFWKL